MGATGCVPPRVSPDAPAREGALAPMTARGAMSVTSTTSNTMPTWQRGPGGSSRGTSGMGASNGGGVLLPRRGAAPGKSTLPLQLLVRHHTREMHS